jgi:predicted nucleotide-binding protein
MEKTVTYPRAKFAPEHLVEAEAALGVHAEPRTLRVNVTRLESWSFDDRNEFYSQYRAGCQSAYYGINDFYPPKDDTSIGDPFGCRWEFYDGQYQKFSVEARTRSEIEACFSVLEKYRNQVTSPEPPDPPSPTPHVFIGHGRSQDWRDLKDQLHEKHGYSVEAYETGVRAGHAIRDILDGMLDQANFAILVLTGEDEMRDGQVRPRENVIHEVGLFQGRLGWSRAILLVEEGVEPCSNIAGIQQIRYSKGNVRSTFGDVLAALKATFPAG